MVQPVSRMPVRIAGSSTGGVGTEARATEPALWPHNRLDSSGRVVVQRRAPMKKRPTLIWIVGIGLIASPIYYYLEAAWSFRVSFGDPALVIGSMSGAKLLGVAAAPLVGLLVLWVRPVSWYAVVAYAAYTLAANAIIFHRTGAGARFFV